MSSRKNLYNILFNSICHLVQQHYHLSLMAGEVDVGDVAGPDRLVDAGGDVRLGRAHRHVAHQVRKVQRQECLHQGVGAMVCQYVIEIQITSQIIKGVFKHFLCKLP